MTDRTRQRSIRIPFLLFLLFIILLSAAACRRDSREDKTNDTENLKRSLAVDVLNLTGDRRTPPYKAGG